MPAYGYKTLLTAFAGYLDIPLVEEEVAQTKVQEFRYPEAAPIEGLQDSPVALPFGFGAVYGPDDAVDIPLYPFQLFLSGWW